MSESVISTAVEGDLDEAVLRRISEHVGFSVGPVYGRKGKPYLLKTLSGFNNAARFSPWIVLVDLDKDFDCAPSALSEWLPQPAEQMHCRVAVRAIESWLLADRDHIASMLAISAKRVPADPDQLEDPKRQIVDLAQRSKRSEIKACLVPRPGSGRAVGPLYVTKLIEFVTTGSWRIEVAAQNSPSLQKALAKFRDIA